MQGVDNWEQVSTIKSLKKTLKTRGFRKSTLLENKRERRRIKNNSIKLNKKIKFQYLCYNKNI